MSNVCIGLFGTCGGSKWRSPFMDMYVARGIDFYNPQVDDWTPECAIEEAEHLVNDQIILFPVTGETYGLGSLAETGFSILSAIRSNINRYVIVYIAQQLDESLTDAALCKESLRSRALVRAHLKKQHHQNVFMVNTLDDMLHLSLRLHEVTVQLNGLHTLYRGLNDNTFS